MREWIVWQAVRSDHRRRVSQDASHILFRNAVIDRSCRLQLPCRVDLRDSPTAGDLRERLSHNLRMWRAPGNRDLDALINLSEVKRARSRSVGITIATNLLRVPCRVQSVQYL